MKAVAMALSRRLYALTARLAMAAQPATGIRAKAMFVATLCSILEKLRE